MTGDCLDPTTIDLLIEGQLSREVVAHLERHLDTCAACMDLVGTLAVSRATVSGSGGVTEAASVTGTTPPGIASALPAGTMLGRYEVRRWLGRGGMGDVYEGFDRHLERRVALKVLRDAASDAELSRLRLGREAKTLARLSHPNVVAVYDVALEGDRLFLVMELVDGLTLASWLKAARRTWRQILDVFLDAGEGLAAAHAVGVIHRDFKPQNVLIGADGRARVSDFGLARAEVVEGRGEGEGRVSPEGATARPSTSSSTATGALVGTPRYMAPEQALGHRIDARADQFSFAVTLWEALYGAHPFVCTDTRAAPDGIKQVSNRVRTANQSFVPPPTARSPSQLGKALNRAFAPDPTHRFASLRDLLVALRRSRRGRSRRAAALLSGLALLVAGGTGWHVTRTNSSAVIQSSNQPADWSDAPVIFQVPGRIRCISAVSPQQLLVIWGDKRQAEEVDVGSKRRSPADLAPDSYRHGCPSRSPDNQNLIFEGFDADQRPHIFYSSNRRGDGAKAVVSSAVPSLNSHPLWLSSNRDFVFDMDYSYPAVFSLETNRTTIIPISDRARTPGFFKAVSHANDIAVMAIRVGAATTTTTISVYQWPSLILEAAAEFDVLCPAFRFGNDPQTLLGRRAGGGYGNGLGVGDGSHNQILLSADVRRRALTAVARVKDRDILDVVRLDSRKVALVSRSFESRLLVRDPGGGEREIRREKGVYYESLSVTKSGDILAVRVGDGSSSVLLIDSAKGTARGLALGPVVRSVNSLPSGEFLVAREFGVFRCPDTGSEQTPSCQPVLREAVLQMAASPGGEVLAFTVLDARQPVVRRLRMDNGEIVDLVKDVTLCRPVWSGPETVWVSRRIGRAIEWQEINAFTRLPTGRKTLGENDCTDLFEDPASPLPPPVRSVDSQVFEIRIHAAP